RRDQHTGMAEVGEFHDVEQTAHAIMPRLVPRRDRKPHWGAPPGRCRTRPRALNAPCRYYLPPRHVPKPECHLIRYIQKASSLAQCNVLSDILAWATAWVTGLQCVAMARRRRAWFR